MWIALYYGVRFLSRLLPLRYRRAKKVALPFATAVTVIAFRFCLKDYVVLTCPIASRLDVGSEAVGLAARRMARRSGGLGAEPCHEPYVVPLASDDPENRRIKTAAYVARRLTLVAVALVSIGYILLRVGIFETFGISVLASAGASGVLVAIARGRCWATSFQGSKLCSTDPVSHPETLWFYAAYWASVEDISFAHILLRTWTDTRLIDPRRDFLSRPFENWSKDGEAVWRIIKIPVDYRIDVDTVRRRVEEIVGSDPRSTGERPEVEMVELTEEVAVLWVWVSGTTASTSWYLHNEVREKLVGFIRDLDNGLYLPRRRHLIVDQPGAAKGSPGNSRNSPTAGW